MGTQRASWDTQTDDALFSKRKGSGRALILIDIMAEPPTVIYIYTHTPNARDDNTFLFAPSLNTIDNSDIGKMKTNCIRNETNYVYVTTPLLLLPPLLLLFFVVFLLSCDFFSWLLYLIEQNKTKSRCVVPPRDIMSFF